MSKMLKFPRATTVILGNFDDHPGLLALNTETNQLAYIDSNGNVIGEIVDPSVNPLYTAIFNQLADPGSFGLDAVPSSSPQSWSGCPLGIYPAWLTTHTKVPQAIGQVNFQSPFSMWSYAHSYQAVLGWDSDSYSSYQNSSGQNPYVNRPNLPTFPPANYMGNYNAGINIRGVFGGGLMRGLGGINSYEFGTGISTQNLGATDPDYIPRGNWTPSPVEVDEGEGTSISLTESIRDMPSQGGTTISEFMPAKTDWIDWAFERLYFTDGHPATAINVNGPSMAEWGTTTNHPVMDISAITGIDGTTHSYPEAYNNYSSAAKTNGGVIWLKNDSDDFVYIQKMLATVRERDESNYGTSIQGKPDSVRARVHWPRLHHYHLPMVNYWQDGGGFATLFGTTNGEIFTHLDNGEPMVWPFNTSGNSLTTPNMNQHWYRDNQAGPMYGPHPWVDTDYSGPTNPDGSYKKFNNRRNRGEFWSRNELHGYGANHGYLPDYQWYNNTWDYDAEPGSAYHLDRFWGMDGLESPEAGDIGYGTLEYRSRYYTGRSNRAEMGDSGSFTSNGYDSTTPPVCTYIPPGGMMPLMMQWSRGTAGATIITFQVEIDLWTAPAGGVGDDWKLLHSTPFWDSSINDWQDNNWKEHCLEHLKKFYFIIEDHTLDPPGWT